MESPSYVIISAPPQHSPAKQAVMDTLRRQLAPFDVREEPSPDGKFHVVRSVVDGMQVPRDPQSGLPVTANGLSTRARQIIIQLLGDEGGHG